MKTATPNWLELVLSLPTQNATARMRIWRALKSAGCVVLRDGVYLLPHSAEAANLLGELAEETSQSGGVAHLLNVSTRNSEQEDALRSLFDRSPDYARLIEEVGQAAKDKLVLATKRLKVLRREYEALVATDFFPGEARVQAQVALDEAEARLFPGEPRAAKGGIKHLDKSNYQARVWATRKHMWVDRMASAWLIRRFIDEQAQFRWLKAPEDCPKKALGFDFDGAAFTHVGNRVTFEVLMLSFALETDLALKRIASVVHYLDVGGITVPEAVGLEAILGGLRSSAANDDALLDAAGAVFDGLYTNFTEGKQHG
jgi:hypothetical protein